MSELDQLRELLDEVGVTYLNRSSDITIGYYTADPQSITEAMDGSLQMTGLTAQQVMRALGHSSNCTNSERTSDELLPYPFCGGIPIADCGYHYDYDGGNRYYAYSADVECCCWCTLHVENEGPKEYVTNEHMLDFAIAAWNRRAES